MAVRRRRRLLAQHVAPLISGERQAHGVHHGVAGRPEHPLAEDASEETTGHDTGLTVASSTSQVVSPVDSSTEHLMPYLQDPKSVRLLAEKSRGVWEVAFIDGVECVTALTLVAQKTKETNCEEASAYAEEGCFAALASWVIKDCVAEKGGSVSCVKLILCFETDMKVQNLREHGPIHMAAFQDMCFNLHYARIVPWNNSSLQVNQVMNKNNESGDRLWNDEFDYCNKSYTGVKISACHWLFVSRKWSSQMANSQCALKQHSNFVPQKHDCMINIFVGCLAHTVDSEYLTACFIAELGPVEKAVVIELKRGNEMKPLGFGFLEFGIEKGKVDGKEHTLGKAMDVKGAVTRASLLSQPKWIPLAKPFSCHLIGLPESASDHHQYPIDPPAASITVGSPHHTESQQVDACSKSKVQRQQGNNCSRSNTERGVTIFVRQISGKVVVLTVNLDEPSEHMMCLYEEKTKMKLSYLYFSYEGKSIRPEHTLLFYGVGPNSTVHACGRLPGGMPTTLASYVHDNGNKFLKEVTLPNGRISLKITKKGCRFLSTWLNCFTKAFSMGKSWNGEFTLDDFKHVDGHILIIKKPRINPAGSMEKDLSEFVFHVEQILHSDKDYLISKYPPYLKNFTRFLSRMTIYGVLSAQDKLFVETHMCCMTSCDKETLVISLYRRYEGSDEDEMSEWDDAIESAYFPVPWSTDLSQLEAYPNLLGTKGYVVVVVVDLSKIWLCMLQIIALERSFKSRQMELN